MPWSITIGKVAGTAIRIHVTFLMFLAWIGFSALRQGGTDAAIANLVFIVALFLCVLLHEFGHILTARRFGIATPDVTLLPIGGVASLERIPEKPSQELLVAIAGPAVNLVIAIALIAAAGATLPDNVGAIDDARAGLVARLAVANIFLAVFNMIPAFPMDGGRVLHALLSMKLGPRRALEIAARIGQGLAFVLGVVGLFGNPFLVFIAIFIYMAAAGEARDTVFRDTIKGLVVGDAMETKFATISIGASIGDAVDILLATPQHEFPVVDGHGKPAGLLTRDAIIGALAQKSRDAPVADIAQSPIPTMRVTQDLEKGLADLQAAKSPAISGVNADGGLVGLLTRENIADMMLIAQAQPGWKFGRRV
jgi:Zn-dependent protease/predicted transcriptional regulator